DAVVQLIELVQAEIVRAPLHVRGGERGAERIAQCGNVLEVDLFLKVLRAGRDQHAFAVEDCRHQIGERLARAGARFGHQHAAAPEHARDGGGHRRLSGARLEVGQRPRQRAVRTEDGGYSGYSGNFRHRVSTSARTMPSARSSPGACSARAMRSAIASISASRMPRVVTAGVPIRIPLATIGGFWSNGIAFLFTVMAALPSAASAT